MDKDDNNKEDEISIDAQKSKISGMHGKIKDFSSTPEISKKFPSAPENSDEEFSLDFSKIKGFFKKKEKAEGHHKEGEEVSETRKHV